MKYQKNSLDQLYSLLESAVQDTVAGLARCSDILLAIEVKKGSHPLMREGALKWYREIANGRLSPKAALTFAGWDHGIRCLIGLPLEIQNNLANGGTVAVAEYNSKNEIEVVEKPIMRIPNSELPRVFEKGKIVTPRVQTRKLRESKIKPPPAVYERIQVDESQGLFIFGNMKVFPHELNGPLDKLGYEPVRKKRTTKKAA